MNKSSLRLYMFFKKEAKDCFPGASTINLSLSSVTEPSKKPVLEVDNIKSFNSLIILTRSSFKFVESC